MTSDLDIGELLPLAVKFKDELAAIKQSLDPSADFWYPYDIIGNLWHLDELLPATHRKLATLIQGLPVADIGAADGDLSFFLSSLGVEVDAIDHEPWNFNGLRGARRLADHLDTSVQIHDLDLNREFRMPRARYGMILLLGVLYHLKNPYMVLETMARHTSYCVVSTRVARYSTDHGTHFGDQPVAYLVAPYECNDDHSNYWIFSPAGLSRIVERSGWEILASLHAGNTERSDPATPEGDERQVLLLASRVMSDRR